MSANALLIITAVNNSAFTSDAMQRKTTKSNQNLTSLTTCGRFQGVSNSTNGWLTSLYQK